MTIQSLDNIISAISNGRQSRFDWNKITGAAAYTAGRWYDMTTLGGSPIANSYPGAALVGTTLDDVFGNGTESFSMRHGGPVDPYVKHVLNMGAWGTAATAVPSTLLLCDFLMAYPGINMNTTSLQTLINSNTVTASSSSGLLLTTTNDFSSGTRVRFTTTGTLPTGLTAGTDYWTVRVSSTSSRVATSLADAFAGIVVPYTDAGTGTHTMSIQIPRYLDGRGCRMFITARSTLGSTAHNIAYTYTNDDGLTRSNPVTVAGTASAIVPHLVHSGTAANNYGPFLPLASGDFGVTKVNTIQLSAASGSASTAAVVVVRPLVSITLGVAGLMVEKDLLNQVPSLPRVIDNACLGFLLGTNAATAAATTFAGHIETIWG